MADQRRRRVRTRSAPPHTEPGDEPRAGRGDPERSLRGLVGAGPSQVSLSAALRARDASQPTDEDLAAAERNVTIVRRGYQPRDPMPETKRRP